jgi:hypothetical protein
MRREAVRDREHSIGESPVLGPRVSREGDVIAAQLSLDLCPVC